MESSICHWFNIGPRNGFLGFSPLDLGFFWCRMGFWVFLAKSDKIWVSEALQFFAAFYYQFTDDTKFHGTETAVVMIFNFFCYYFIYFAQLPHVHCGTEIQLIRDD